MSEKDDRDWFDLVAGREVPDADPAVRVEAAAVRHVLLAAQAGTDADQPIPIEGDAARTQRLIERARAEGLIPQGTSPNGHEGSQPRGRRSPLAWLFGARGALALAATVVLAIGIFLAQRPEQLPDDEAVTSRGGAPQLVVREVPDPTASAKGLAEALRAEGLVVKVYQSDTSWYVETTVPDRRSAAVVSALERASVFTVQPGSLRVMFRGRQ